MNKLIVLSISVIIVASCLMAMNTSAAGTFKDSIESDAYIKKIEKLNNNRILSPELIEILPDVIYNDNINYGEIVNVWKSRDSVTGASDFIFECSHSDSFEIMIDPSKVETGVEIDEIVGYIKNKIAYSENVEIKGERTNGYFNVNGKFKTDNHDLNRMIFEKAYVLLNEKYGVADYAVDINTRSFNEVIVHDSVYLFDGSTRSAIDTNLVDHDMILEKYNATYDAEKRTIRFSDNTSTGKELGCLQYFRNNYDAIVGVEFIFSNQSFASEIDITNTEFCDGDANLDGKSTVADSVAILQHIANRDKYELKSQGAFNADVDGEVGITANDARVLKEWDSSLN